MALFVQRSIKRPGLYATNDSTVSGEHLYDINNNRPHKYAINDNMTLPMRHQRLYHIICIHTCHHQVYDLIYIPSKLIRPYLYTNGDYMKII
jgi:hypothetical protein